MLYVGLAYLAWFGINALRRAVRPGHAVLDTNAGGTARARARHLCNVRCRSS
jgi:hypothetical protein